MFVLFATTNGNLLLPYHYQDKNISKDSFATNLGAVTVIENGIVIVDREYEDTSLVDTESLLNLIKHMYVNVFQNQPTTIILPKITNNMYDEAKIQTQLLSIADNVKLVFV